MKKFILFVLLFLVSTNLFYGSEMGYLKYEEYLDSTKFSLIQLKDYKAETGDLLKADFCDSTNGYILGDLSNSTSILKTTDRGQSWINSRIDSLISIKDTVYPYKTKIVHYPQIPINIKCINKDTIIAFASLQENLPLDPYLTTFTFFISINGGVDWQSNDFKRDDTLEFAKSFDILKNGYGLIGTNKGIHKTNNYGYNLSSLITKDSIFKLLNDTTIKYIDIKDIKIFDNKRFIFSILNYTTWQTIILRTNDELNSIEYINQPQYFDFYITNCDFIDSNKIWVSGYYKDTIDNYYHCAAFYTSNFGKAWEKKFDFNIKLTDGFINLKTIIKFKNDSIGIITGQERNFICLTRDGGITWKNLVPERCFDSINPMLFNSIYFEPNGKALFMGSSCADAITYNINQDTSVTSVQEFPQINSKQTIVCPNPVQDILTISNLLNDFNYNTNIEIYNIYGLKEIEIPYTDKIDVSKLSVGIYYLKINNQFTKFVK